MTKRTWKIFLILLVVGLMTGFIRYQFASGLLLGAIISCVIYLRNESFWNGVVDRGFATKGTGSLHFMFNYILMAFPLIFCALKQEYFNIFACAIGLVMVKCSLVIDAVLFHGKEDSE